MADETGESRLRYAGILLHPTSLPGPYGIGDLGSEAYFWIDRLAQAEQKWWQILPLNPTGYGDSPYSSFSAFAGNPYLVNPDMLAQDGLIHQNELSPPAFPVDRVDYGWVSDYKTQLFKKVWDNFQGGAAPSLRSEFESFQEAQKRWLDDYALFRALKDHQEGKPWYEWHRDLIDRKPSALAAKTQELRHEVGFHKFCQFLFSRQWKNLRNYAHGRGIGIIGDAPIFVSLDSCDVWANPHLFLLDENRKPTKVAGVPPDYFSATGQLWGNPLYDWPRMQKTGFAWWIDRIKTNLETVDIIRLDHFRGFEAYWAVPAGMDTAESGQWVKAPGAEFFTVLQKALNGLPIIAEDLGLITPEVNQLRRQFHLPGMRVLQFAFDGKPDNPYLPHNYDFNTVAYTGTHDNNTTRGWYEKAPDQEKDYVRRYLARDGGDISWDLIRAAWSSVADYAIAPLQDILNLGTEARMNFPGRGNGNWCWRFRREMLQESILDRLADLTNLYGR